MNNKSTRFYSDEQEKRIAKRLGGQVQCNSGGTRFGGGDIHTPLFLIEAKTGTEPKLSFSVKKQWLEKAKLQAFEQGKLFSALAISFDNQHDYFIIDEDTFKYVHNLIIQNKEEL